MPFDPNSPFDPTDPAQWWRLQNLPHILVQPKAPPNPASGSGEDDGLPNDWFVPEADGFPNDWIYPDNNTPAPSPTPSAAQRAPNPQPNPAANRSLEHLDPYHAFWAQMPASRAGAMAWHPPIFLSPDPSTWLPPFPTFSNSFGTFPATANVLAPDLSPGSIPDGIGRVLAEQAHANDPLANGIFGIPRVIAASAWSDPMSLAASRVMFGSPANLQAARPRTRQERHQASRCRGSSCSPIRSDRRGREISTAMPGTIRSIVATRQALPRLSQQPRSLHPLRHCFLRCQVLCQTIQKERATRMKHLGLNTTDTAELKGFQRSLVPTSLVHPSG